MRKAKSIFQGKKEPVWVRPNRETAFAAFSRDRGAR